jgi:hypothetical protein
MVLYQGLLFMDFLSIVCATSVIIVVSISRKPLLE